MATVWRMRVAALALLLSIVGVEPARALVDDLDSSETQPGASLVAPFDLSAGHASFLVVSQLGGRDAVATHWTFWSESCEHLLDVWICLTPEDTVVVDPSDVRAVGEDNDRYGPKANLAGERGFVVVTAFEPGPNCIDPIRRIPVDDAIVGSFTIASLASSSAFGADAVAYGLDVSGTYVALPDFELPWVDLQTFAPESLGESSVILMGLREGGPGRIELEPLAGIRSDVAFFDVNEVRV
jgi:hypothetical protein